MTGLDMGLVMNLIFCLIVLAMGIWAYFKNKSYAALYLGIAFAFYAVSHVLGLMGLAESLNMVGVVTRAIGYLLTIYAVYLLIAKK